MNAAGHKAQAEALIKEHNAGETWRSQKNPRNLIMLAQVHATLALVEDDE
jgi:hypothetical protein